MAKHPECKQTCDDGERQWRGFTTPCESCVALEARDLERKRIWESLCAVFTEAVINGLKKHIYPEAATEQRRVAR